MFGSHDQADQRCVWEQLTLFLLTGPNIHIYIVSTVTYTIFRNVYSFYSEYFYFQQSFLLSFSSALPLAFSFEFSIEFITKNNFRKVVHEILSVSDSHQH